MPTFTHNPEYMSLRRLRDTPLPAKRWAWILPWLLAGLAACTPGREAQKVARGTLEQVMTYEDRVTEKIKAEQTYYDHSHGDIDKSIGRSKYEAEANVIAAHAMDFQATLARMRDPLQAADLKNFMKKGLEDLRQVREKYDPDKLVYEKYDKLFRSMVALELQKQPLGKVRQGLGQLQTKPAAAAQIKEWFEFARKIKEELDKPKEQPKK